MTQIRDAIKKIAKPNNDGYSVLCTVDSVDLLTLTCYCIPINGEGDIQGVKLMANVENGFTIIPKVNSKVLVSFLSDQIGFVSMFSGVSEIRLNGVVNGGLIKIDNLKTQYDANVAAIKAACVAGFTALSGLDSGASLSAFNASATAILNLNKTTLENTTVKHGNG